VNLTRRCGLVALVCAFFAPPGFATAAPQEASRENPAPKTSTSLSSEDVREVARIVDYLQGLTSERSRFVQTDARGVQTEGAFYLQRPGRARFEYDPPSGLIIASDGRRVTVVDRRLKTRHAYPQGATPLELLLDRNIRLDRGVIVRQVARDQGNVTVVAEDARRKAKGQIALTFTETPMALTGWAIKDARGGVVRVRLAGLAHTPPHDASFFELPDPRSTPDPDASR